MKLTACVDFSTRAILMRGGDPVKKNIIETRLKTSKKNPDFQARKQFSVGKSRNTYYYQLSKFLFYYFFSKF